MATLELDPNESPFQIRSFAPGHLYLNDRVLTKSCIMTARTLIEDWPVLTIQSLSTAHLSCILSLVPLLLLIGTGEYPAWIAPEKYGLLINQGIAVEIMSTRAACHTFNVLTAENRSVAAALILR